MALQREDNDYSSNTPIQLFEGYRDAYVFADSLFFEGILRAVGDGVGVSRWMIEVLKKFRVEFPVRIRRTLAHLGM
jgi:hypothetical protein